MEHQLWLPSERNQALKLLQESCNRTDYQASLPTIKNLETCQAKNSLAASTQYRKDLEISDHSARKKYLANDHHYEQDLLQPP